MANVGSISLPRYREFWALPTRQARNYERHLLDAGVVGVEHVVDVEPAGAVDDADDDGRRVREGDVRHVAGESLQQVALRRPTVDQSDDAAAAACDQRTGHPRAKIINV